MPSTGSRVRIPVAQLEWLRQQSARWRDEGLLTDSARAAVLDRYEADTPQGRGLQVLVAIGILICAVGLLLLVGYNWAQLTPAIKVTLVLVAVSGAFLASAFAYRAGRPALGETFAFAGMLLYANGIWLIAQALNIQGHYPDAFFWAGVGALACAWLVRSPWNGLAAAVLLLVWGVAEGVSSPGNNYLFLLVWPVAVWTARRLDAPVMLALTAAAGAVWVAVIDHGVTGGVLLPASITFAGCALYAVGAYDRAPLAYAWRGVGLLTLLVMLVPLMVLNAQRGMLLQTGTPPLPLVLVTVALAALALLGMLRARTSADWAVAAIAVATCVWAGLAMAGVSSAAAGTVLFSLATLAVGVAFVRTALVTGSTLHLAAGVIFACTFLLVRWISVVGNLLWSGVLLLAAGGGLLLLARLWRARGRDGAAAPGGTA